MDKITKQKILMTAFSQLAENFNSQISEVLMKTWLSLAEDENPELVVMACRAVMKNYVYKTLPPYAVINKELEKLKYADEESIDAKASAEWFNLLNLISEYGSYRKPTLEPKLEYVVRCMGGWCNVCAWEEKNLNFRQKEFCELYKQAETKSDVIEKALPNNELIKLMNIHHLLKSIE